MAKETGDILFYWRPGCWFCANLRRKLEDADVQFRAINIWEDAEAAASVRTVAGGNETVPTVFVGARAMVNPSANAVLKAIHAETPGERAAVSAPSPSLGRLTSFLRRLGGSGR